jgi:hypothetical protein
MLHLLVILFIPRRPIWLWLFWNNFSLTFDELSDFVFLHKVTSISRVSDIFKVFCRFFASLLKENFFAPWMLKLIRIVMKLVIRLFRLIKNTFPSSTSCVSLSLHYRFEFEFDKGVMIIVIQKWMIIKPSRRSKNGSKTEANDK